MSLLSEKSKNLLLSFIELSNDPLKDAIIGDQLYNIILVLEHIEKLLHRNSDSNKAVIHEIIDLRLFWYKAVICCITRISSKTDSNIFVGIHDYLVVYPTDKFTFSRFGLEDCYGDPQLIGDYWEYINRVNSLVRDLSDLSEIN